VNGDLTTLPSPKFQAYSVIGAPGATEAPALNMPMKAHLLWIVTARAVKEGNRSLVRSV
jgi:hypothetical protein